ncbi:hypothetical protein H9P43_008647 [Blastocladiella emersonii ATCC 22665]|nr:hypothetical protein H9P43_008647 [Blastocladiella emersonii ATCC 22665]
MRGFLLHADVSESTRATLAPFLDDDHVPFSVLLACHTETKERVASEDGVVPPFDELTRGSRVHFAPQAPKPKVLVPVHGPRYARPLTATLEWSPELQRILAAIRAEQEEFEYERMKGRRLSDLASPDAAHLVEDPKAVSKVLIGSFNVFFTAASVFVAVMWIGPTISDNVAWRVMAAFSLAMIILAGEGWLAYRSAFQRKME